MKVSLLKLKKSVKAGARFHMSLDSQVKGLLLAQGASPAFEESTEISTGTERSKDVVTQ